MGCKICLLSLAVLAIAILYFVLRNDRKPKISEFTIHPFNLSGL